jgi:multidrug efflux system outer membrane protein
LANAVEQARAAHRLALLRYEAGAEDLLALLDSQRSLLEAEDTLVQTQALRFGAAVDLFAALGGGWVGAEA